MTIRFSRSSTGPVLTCIRADGSTVWSKSRHGDFFVRHDLMHYAVESILDLREAFFGLIASGWSISDFEAPGAAARLPVEALHAEYIVGLLDQQTLSGATHVEAEFNANLAAALAGAKGGPLPPMRRIAQRELDAVHERFTQTYIRWRELRPEAMLELSFPSPLDAASSAPS